MIKPSQYPYTLNRFFQHMKEAVKYFPDNQSLKLNTFAYINALDDLNKENLGYDIRSAKSDYFFSKRWEKKKTSIVEMDFPALLIGEEDHSTTEIFNPNNQSRKITYNLTLWVVDTVNSLKKETATNQDRLIGDIYRDTRLILIYVLSYLQAIRFYKITNLDSSISYGYYHPDVIEALDTAGDITSYTGRESDHVNNWLKGMFEKNNDTQLGILEPISEKLIAGTRMNFKMETAICLDPEFDFDFTSNPFSYAPNL